MSGRLGHLAIVALAWTACGVGSALVLARLSHVDEKRSLLIGATTALPVLLMQAYGALVAGLFTGQRALTLVALLLIGCHLVISAPLVAGRRGVTTHGEGAQDLRVLALNVEYDKDTGARITDQVRRWDPDLVVLSEVSALTLTHLDLMQYPYSFVAPRPDAFGGGVWSRYPVRLKAAYIGGRQMIAGTIELPGGSLSLRALKRL